MKFQNKIKKISTALLISLCLFNTQIATEDTPNLPINNFQITIDKNSVTISPITIDITLNNYVTEVEQSPVPVVLEVYAPWCGPCKRLKPIFESLATESLATKIGTKYKFGKINFDQEKGLVETFEISSIPTLIFLKDGKVIGRHTGFLNKDALKKKIEEILS